MNFGLESDTGTSYLIPTLHPAMAPFPVWSPRQSFLSPRHSRSRLIYSCSKAFVAIYYKAFTSSFFYLTVEGLFNCLQFQSVNKKKIVISVNTLQNSQLNSVEIMLL